MQRAALALMCGWCGLPTMRDGGRPKRVKTETIRRVASALPILYAVEPDGIVRIDWRTVELKISAIVPGQALQMRKARTVARLH